MIDRPRLFDGVAGLAGTALSAFQAWRDEVEAIVRSRVDEALDRLDLARREELDAVRELAANARMAGTEAQARIEALEARLAALEGGADAAP